MRPSFYLRNRWLCFAFYIAILGFVLEGALDALRSNSNNVADWLPERFEEKENLDWFWKHFGGDGILMISWDDCTPDDPRTERLAELLAQPATFGDETDLVLFKNILTPQLAQAHLLEQSPDISDEAALGHLEHWLVGAADPTSGERRGCLVTASGSDFWRHTHRAIAHIYDCADRVEGLSRDTIHLAGPMVDGVAIDRVSGAGLFKLTGLSIAVCAIIMLVCFRNVVLAAIVMSAALLNQALSLAIMSFTGATMDAISLMVPSLVFVLSVSAGVHLFNYYRDAIGENTLRRAPILCVRHGWLPCVLAAVTTATGLFSLLSSSLLPIRKFGIYSAAGLLVGTIVLFTLVPCQLEQFPPKRWAARLRSRTREAFSISWQRPLAWLSRLHLPIVVASVGLLVVSIWGLQRIEATARIHDMLSPQDQLIRDYNWLEQNIGPLVPIEIVLRLPQPDEQQSRFGYPLFDRLRLVRAVDRAATQCEGVGAVSSASRFTPRPPPPLKQGQRLSSRQIARLRGMHSRLEGATDQFVESGLLRQTDDEQFWRITARVNASDKQNYPQLMSELRSRIEPLLAQHSQLNMPGATAVYCGGVPLFQKAQDQLLVDLFNSFIMAFAIIGVMMIVLLRSIPAGLVSMVPNVLPCVAAFGTMGWLGIEVEAGTMMTATAAMGIAVDDTLHFLTWFRRGVTEGRSRQESIALACERCGVAMIQTTLITGIGLLVYMLSDFGPISRFGGLMASMLAAALLADLIVLPALLFSPLGRLFMPAEKTVVHHPESSLAT